MKIEDLDALLPEKKILKIGGKEIDVSFIPCGITFKVDRIMQELHAISKESILENGESTKKAFDLSVELCATFCEHKNPELDFNYFMHECDAIQVKKFVGYIQEALTRAYLGVKANSKNALAPKRKKIR